MSEDNPTDAAVGAHSRPQIKVWLRYIRRILLRRLPAGEAQEVRQGVDADGAFSERYALMCALSAGIATLGLLQSSSAVVIGAMLVSPLMSPIAKLGFSFASFDGRRAQDGARVLAIGAVIGIAVGMVLTWLSPIRNATPEIIARTAPTLLDLAVAVLSGLAGGYATVHRRGETAIGVAIATALMPPLATIGYSIAVGRWNFAGGATLLFLTNLAAIAFSFALVARVRGVVRPLAHVEFKRRYVVLGVTAFLVLAAPLGMTLRRVTQEASASAAARQEISRLFAIDTAQIAQLSVDWSKLDGPSISAVAITSKFHENAEAQLSERLRQRLHANVHLSVQQIVAADPSEQTRAVIAAATARAVSAPTTDTSSMNAVRAATRAPIVQIWSDGQTREIFILAAPRTDWSLAQYRAEEARLGALGFNWSVRVVPPYEERIAVLYANDSATLDADQRSAIGDAVWALRRWGVSSVVVEGLSGSRPGATRNSRLLAQTRAAGVGAILEGESIRATVRLASAATATALAREGVARVRSADILPFASP